MIQALHPDDAFTFIVEKLRANSNGYGTGNNATYDVWLPSLVWQYVLQIGYSPNRQAEHQNDSEFEDIWRAFYDAAWRLCRLGVFRPTASWARYAGSVMSAAGNGYSYTSHGVIWFKTSDLLFIPSDPARYLALLSKEAERLGQGFAQRAREAAACHQTGNHLACCAMCGAAAESAILQTAITKIGDEDQVLEEYLTPSGRRRVMEIIFGPSPSKLQERFISSAANLLFYWRDETAHGQASTVSEIEAFHSLTLLVRLAQFLFGNWESLTKATTS
jgi:hypothetical protein